MAEIVYHGTSTRGLKRLVACAGDFSADLSHVLYVTDSPALAARYANAQATRVVDADVTTPGEHTAIISIETDSPRWHRRPAKHGSLDRCEAVISSGRIIAAELHECAYAPCTCHRDMQAFRAAFGV